MNFSCRPNMVRVWVRSGPVEDQGFVAPLVTRNLKIYLPNLVSSTIPAATMAHLPYEHCEQWRDSRINASLGQGLG